MEIKSVHNLWRHDICEALRFKNHAGLEQMFYDLREHRIKWCLFSEANLEHYYQLPMPCSSFTFLVKF